MRQKGVQRITRMCMKYYPWDNAFPGWAARTSNQAVRRGVRAGTAQSRPRDAAARPHPAAAFCCSFWGSPPDPVPGFRPALRSSQGAAQEGSCLFSTCPDFRQCVHQLRSAPSPAKCLCREEEMFVECLSEDPHMWLGQDNPGLYAVHC